MTIAGVLEHGKFGACRVIKSKYQQSSSQHRGYHYDGYHIRRILSNYERSMHTKFQLAERKQVFLIDPSFGFKLYLKLQPIRQSSANC